MDAGASVIAFIQIVEVVFSCLRDIRNSSPDRERLLLELSSLLHLLQCLEDYTKIEDLKSTPDWFLAVKQLKVQGSPLNQLKSALESLRTKVEPKNKMRSVAKSLLWPLTKKDVQDLLQRIERVKSLLAIALTLDHKGLTRAIQEDVQAIKAAVDRSIRSDKDAARQQQFSAMLAWLGLISPTEVETQFRSRISERIDGTGAHHLDGPEFTNWASSTVSNTLICVGDPGAGKTIMATSAIDFLRRGKNCAESPVLFFYFDYTSKVKLTLNNIIGSLLRQLLLVRDSVPDDLITLKNKYEPGGRQPSQAELSQVLRNVVQQLAQLYVVIDALDECGAETRDEFVYCIQSLDLSLCLKVLITTRRLPDILRLFPHNVMYEVAAQQSDIELYVDGRVRHLPEEMRQNYNAIATIKKGIWKLSEGVFLFAKLHMAALEDEIMPGLVEATLNKLLERQHMANGQSFAFSSDSRHNEHYDIAIERIMAQKKGATELAISTFQWLLGSQTTLSSVELQHAIAINGGEYEPRDSDLPSINAILCVCAGLVVFDTQRQAVRFVHYTAQEYFYRRKNQFLLGTHMNLARSCISCLSWAFRNAGMDQLKDDDEMRSRYPFVDYAARSWGFHARQIDQSDDIDAVEQIGTLIFELFSQPGNLERMSVLQRRFGVGTLAHDIFFMQSRLHIMAREGLSCWFKKLRFLPINYNSRDFSESTPLHIAAEGQHEKLVRTLLDLDKVRLNVRNMGGRTPFEVAVDSGHVTVIEVFLGSERFLELNANCRDGAGWTPVLRAAACGNVDVIRSLLNSKKTDREAQDFRGRKALHIAAHFGQRDAVHYFLGNGFDPFAKTKDGWTALTYAVYEGRLNLATMILRFMHPGFAKATSSIVDCYCAIVQRLKEDDEWPEGRWPQNGLAAREEREPLDFIEFCCGGYEDEGEEWPWTLDTHYSLEQVVPGLYFLEAQHDRLASKRAILQDLDHIQIRVLRQYWSKSGRCNHCDRRDLGCGFSCIVCKRSMVERETKEERDAIEERCSCGSAFNEKDYEDLDEEEYDSPDEEEFDNPDEEADGEETCEYCSSCVSAGLGCPYDVHPLEKYGSEGVLVSVNSSNEAKCAALPFDAV